MDKAYKDLIDELNELNNTRKVLVSVASTILAVQKERIFDKGLDGNDQKIGEYSSKPISISIKRQVRNTGQSYFKEGYKQYKQLSGKDPSKVTLVDTGQLMMDYSIIPIDDRAIGIGFKNPLNTLKAEGNEKRFKKEIFAQSPSEDEIFDRVFQYELDRVFGR